MSKPWTKYELDFLATSWMSMSATKIGEALGRTKSSVIGKAHRLNLPQKRPTPATYKNRARRENGKLRTKQRKTIKKTETASPRPVAESTTYGTCQYIAGQPSADDSCKCGASVTAARRSYCLKHYERTHQHRVNGVYMDMVA